MPKAKKRTNTKSKSRTKPKTKSKSKRTPSARKLVYKQTVKRRNTPNKTIPVRTGNGTIIILKVKGRG